MPVILADRHIPYLDVLAQSELQVIPLRPEEITRTKLLETRAEGLLIRTRTKVNSNLLDGTAVHFIGTATIGMDHIDTLWCKSRGIEVVSAPGCNAGGVMQYIAAALAQYFTTSPKNPDGLTLGIVGYGNTGRLSAKVGNALGMRILINDPPLADAGYLKNDTPLKQLLSESDVVTLHVPYTSRGAHPTRYLLNEGNIKYLKPTNLLINTSRGGVVDEMSLLKFKSEHPAFHYILDVWENEPDLNKEVLYEAFLATPHIAGYSLDGKRNASQVIFNAVLKHFGFGEDIVLPDIIPRTQPEINARHLMEAILEVYPITADDRRLRREPGSFEKLRSNYPFRHEFHHFTLSGLDEVEKRNAQVLGFKIKD
ncbi:MAG: 4-phosphoerythronate dehydrogenase [Bacteroidales bacterium]